jgi:hypothetical protein
LGRIETASWSAGGQRRLWVIFITVGDGKFQHGRVIDHLPRRAA